MTSRQQLIDNTTNESDDESKDEEEQALRDDQIRNFLYKQNDILIDESNQSISQTLQIRTALLNIDEGTCFSF